MFKAKGKEKPIGTFKHKKERGDHSGAEHDKCYKYRVNGHSFHKFHTPEHLIGIYQQSNNKI
jgi:hypothetical protein